MPEFSPDAMRARFRELAAKKAKIEASAKSLRDEYDALRKEEQKIAAKQAPIVAKFKKIEAPLIEIGGEMAMIARALNGKTGPQS